MKEGSWGREEMDASCRGARADLLERGKKQVQMWRRQGTGTDTREEGAEADLDWDWEGERRVRIWLEAGCGCSDPDGIQGGQQNCTGRGG